MCIRDRPSAMQNAVVSFSNIIMQSTINVFGAYAMAGTGSYTKIDGFAILPDVYKRQVHQ